MTSDFISQIQNEVINRTILLYEFTILCCWFLNRKVLVHNSLIIVDLLKFVIIEEHLVVILEIH